MKSKKQPKSKLVRLPIALIRELDELRVKKETYLKSDKRPSYQATIRKLLRDSRQLSTVENSVEFRAFLRQDKINQPG